MVVQNESQHSLKIRGKWQIKGMNTWIWKKEEEENTYSSPLFISFCHYHKPNLHRPSSIFFTLLLKPPLTWKQQPPLNNHVSSPYEHNYTTPSVRFSHPPPLWDNLQNTFWRYQHIHFWRITVFWSVEDLELLHYTNGNNATLHHSKWAKSMLSDTKHNLVSIPLRIPT